MIYSGVFKFSLVSAGKVFCRPDWLWDSRKPRLRDFDLWCILGGRGTMQTGNHTYELSAGDFFLLYPNIRFYAENDPDDPMVVVFAHFDIFRNGEKIMLLKDSPVPDFHRRMPNLLFFDSLLQRMVEQWLQNEPDKAELWLAAALSEIAHGRKDSEKPGGDSALTEIVRRVYRQINAQPEQKYSLRKLARKHGACPEHFSRTFTKANGCSFRAAVTGAKLRHAKLLLTSTNYSITAIAEILGFGSVYHFSKLFKKQTGHPPTEFRKS